MSQHGEVTVWTDASSLGLGVALEVDGSIVWDASWLRKESVYQHINVAELEAVGRGVNMAIAWGFKTFYAGSLRWLLRNCVRTKGTAEMLVKHRLGVIGDIITEYGLNVTVCFVPSV